ncbi:TIR domain-containing protein [Sphingomonas sp. Marseille-Q8236]
MKPRVFIGSSVEQVDLAYAVQESLEYDVEATVWTQGVFQPSRTTMAALVDQLDVNDFAIFVLAPDDLTLMRKETVSSVRDNVIFELGLFSGRYGHERCFIVTPRNSDDLHLPTDLLGITPAEYDADRQDKNLVAALGAACNRIRKSIRQLGPRAVPVEQPVKLDQGEQLTDDRKDCISLIESWMGRRSSGSNKSAIRFSDVDTDLKLAPGSARQYLAEAASKWGYIVDREGKDTIKFKDG